MSRSFPRGAGVPPFKMSQCELQASGSVRFAIGSSSSDVFERRTSTGSEPFSLLVSLDATVFILPSVLILKETICPKICSKSRLKYAKSPFPVDVRRSKTSLLKLPTEGTVQRTPAVCPAVSRGGGCKDSFGSRPPSMYMLENVGRAGPHVTSS